MMPSLFLLRRGMAVVLARHRDAFLASWASLRAQGPLSIVAFSWIVMFFALFLLCVVGAVLVGVGVFSLFPEGTSPRFRATPLVLTVGGLVLFSMACFVIYAALLPRLQRRWPALRIPKDHHILGLMGGVTVAGTFLILALVGMADAGRIGVTIGGLFVLLALLVLAGRMAFAVPPALRRVQETGLASLSAHQRLSLLARRAAAQDSAPPPQV